jgi:uncharacterized protein involved in exopolysaccharide biosynthesis
VTANAAGSSKPDNGGLSGESPQAQQLRAQLHQIDVTIRERTTEQARIQQSVSKVQARLQLSPAIAQQYKALTRDYQTALNFYNDFLKKQTDAGVSTELERRQQGEQFRVLDPPSLPQKPTFPNRRVFGFGGLVAGLGLGLSVALFLEARDTSLRTDRDVELLLKLPVLALIPVVQAVRGIRDSDGIGNGNIKPPAETAKLGIGV